MRTISKGMFVLTGLLVLSLGLTASADTLKLKDGRTLEGYYQGGSASVIKFEMMGKTQDVPVETIASLTFGRVQTTQAPPPQPKPAAPSGPVVVNAGTRIMIRTQDLLDTGQTKTGARFTCVLEANLVVNGVVVAQKGSKVYGKVVQSRKAKRVRGTAKLVVELTDLEIKGQLQPIISEQVGYEGDKQGTVKKVGGAAAVGAIFDGGEGAKKGAGVGLALSVLSKGKQISIPAGTLFEFRLAQPLTLQL